MKPCIKILVSVEGGTKNFFSSKLYTYQYLVKMVSSFSLLSGYGEVGFSDTNVQEIDIELIRPR